MLNERWYSLTIEEAEKKLNTNVSSGLDPREAERRRRRGDAGSVYKPIAKSPLYHASRVAADITVILFILAALISAFFNGGKPALAAALLATVAFFAAIVCYILAVRRLEASAEYSLPRSKVLRGGRVYVIDCRDVVTGDVILLEKGDVVPCDCRLVNSEGMRAIEFVGKILGKEKKMLTTKDAFAILRPEEKPNVASQKNMIGAASVIASGCGRAIAVRTGRKTFVSLMLGELEACPASKREMKVLEGISKLLSKFTLAVLIATVPVTIISMLVGKNNIGILDVLLVLLSLAVTSGSEIVGGMTYLFSSESMKRSEKSGGIIKYPDALQEMNYIDSVMLFGNKSICCKEKNVESIFAANRFYDAATAKKNSDQALNCLLDLALLGTSHYLDAGASTEALSLNNSIIEAKAIEEFSASCGIDRSKLSENYQLIEFSGNGASEFDTSLIKNNDEYRIICVSANETLLGLCTHIRTPEGALFLEADKKSDIMRACNQLKKKAKSVTLIASRISPCSSLSRLGALQNQLIFEGYIVYSAPYPASLTDQISEMHEADISIYYISEENADSVITAFNIGAVKGKHEIAYSSSFKRNNKDILDNFGQYRAYLGFDSKDVERLAKQIRGDDGTLAVIVSETENLAHMNAANISVAVSELEEKKTAITSISGYSEIARKNADVIVSPPKKDGGGFVSFAGAVLESKNACAGLCKFIRYLAFSTALRLVLVFLPLFFGHMLLNAAQVMFLGAFIDLPAIFFFAFGKHTAAFTDRIADIETMISSPFRSLAKYIVSGTALGAIMLMLAAVFGSSNIATGKLLSVFSLMGVALSQLFALFIISRLSDSNTIIKRTFGLFALLIIILIAIALFIPSFGAFIGVSYPGWQVCAAAPLASVIGYVMILVTDRYI